MVKKYSFEPPWYFKDHTPYERFKEISKYFDDVERRIEDLEKQKKLYEEGRINYGALRTEMGANTDNILEKMEIIATEFEGAFCDEIKGYSDLTSPAAEFFWRYEDGRWKGESHDRSILERIEKLSNRKYRVREMERSLEEMFSRNFDKPPIDDFDGDIREAKDLAFLEYYTTSILVLFRACETAVRKLGDERKIEEITFSGDEKSWEDCGATTRITALNQFEAPDRKGKMIENPLFNEFKRIKKDHRDEYAHNSDTDIRRPEAVREMKNTLALLRKLSKRIKELREHEGVIDPIKGNTVHHKE